jgi:hypothetical protein
MHVEYEDCELLERRKVCAVQLRDELFVAW